MISAIMRKSRPAAGKLSTAIAIAFILAALVSFGGCGKDKAAPEGGVQTQDTTPVAVISSEAGLTPAAATSPAAAATTPSNISPEPSVNTVTTVSSSETTSSTTDSTKKASESSGSNKKANTDTSKTQQGSKPSKSSAGSQKTPTSGGNKANPPKPAEPSGSGAVSAPDPKKTLTCTVAADCKTLLAADPDMAGQVSDNGVILGSVTVEVPEGSCVLDVLKASGIPFVGSAYIKTIGGLSEFDAGPKSGWIYNVNGVYPGAGVKVYKVKDGDKIQFRYTCNGGSDVK